MMIVGKKYHVSDVSEERAEMYKQNPNDKPLVYIGYCYGKMFFEENGHLNSYKYAILADEVDQKATTQTGDLQEGDLVYVNNWSEKEALHYRIKRIYLMTLKNGKHLVVSEDSETYYKNNEVFDTMQWAYVVPVSKEISLTKEEIAEKFNIPVDQLRIVD